MAKAGNVSRNQKAELRTCNMEVFWAVSMFVSAYLVSHNILYPSVMFWQQNIIPQSLCLAVISQSLKDYQKSHPYVGKQMREGEDGVKHDFHPQLCPQELLCMVFSFGCADKSGQGGHHCPTSYHSFSIPISTPSCFHPIPIFPTSQFRPPPPPSFSHPALFLHSFSSPPPSVPPSIRTLRHIVIVRV